MQPFSLIFWAILCVLAGIVLLLRQFTPATFSPFKVIGGLFILLLGISLLITPKPSSSTPEQVVFDQGSAVIAADGEHSCVFGQSTVDLTNTQPGSKLKINCVFGQCDVKLPQNTAVEVKASCAFGSISGDGIAIAMGEGKHSYPGEGKAIELELNTAFGQITLIR